MIERQFWEEAKRVWIVEAPPKIKEIKTGSGGAIDPSLLKDPWDMEEIPFDQVDYDGAVKAAFEGGDIPIKTEYKGKETPIEVIEEPPVPKRPQLDVEAFEACLEKRNLLEYVKACKLLMKCELPENMDSLYKELIERIPVLDESIVKFESVYQPDMEQFYDYFIPEALQLTASYLEYLDVGIGEEILMQTENEVVDAVKKLIIGVNDKIDEIYKYASIEIKAKAKALESMMSQNGHVDPQFKLKTED